ncbi:hypothetical protein QYM36_015560 [Artemia franciscana]|uniref:Uncharacterized protein n=1 Tax=Artemia franciscana TaxID=6661 RepID=A0AA88HCN4_ARTSF|nr:hypothetical protein QYM36_015560 [Artemia franciscana]
MPLVYFGIIEYVYSVQGLIGVSRKQVRLINSLRLCLLDYDQLMLEKAGRYNRKSTKNQRTQDVSPLSSDDLEPRTRKGKVSYIPEYNSHLELNNLISDHQHGFHKNRSTVSQLVVIHDYMQSDLDALTEKREEWQLSQNLAKCSVVHLGRQIPMYSYKMKGIDLTKSTCEKDLGVILSLDLKPEKYIGLVVRKPSNTLWLLSQSLRYLDNHSKISAYISYVRPQLEYATGIWSPYLKKGIDRIERARLFKTLRLTLIDCVQPMTKKEKLRKIESLEKFRAGDRAAQEMLDRQVHWRRRSSSENSDPGRSDSECSDSSSSSSSENYVPVGRPSRDLSKVVTRTKSLAKEPVSQKKRRHRQNLLEYAGSSDSNSVLETKTRLQPKRRRKHCSQLPFKPTSGLGKHREVSLAALGENGSSRCRTRFNMELYPIDPRHANPVVVLERLTSKAIEELSSGI